MARNDPQVNLRMPADLKDRLDAAASRLKRSLTAEIVARLERSFERTPEEQARNAEFQKELKEIVQDSVDFDDDRRTVYVALDANGMPLSWPEIMKHLGEIGRAGGFDVQKIEGMVFRGEVPSSDNREDALIKLYRDYRKLRRKKRAATYREPIDADKSD